MKRYTIVFLLVIGAAQAQQKLTESTIVALSKMPLHCINTIFPNKINHLSDSEVDARMLPQELHPSFYGCLDWHSSVHGHWMLVKLLKEFPNLPNRSDIIAVLDQSFVKKKIQLEADYFGKYTSSKNFERTYGWAWLLKLDEELGTWNDELGKKWHAELQPLTQRIVSLWKEFLPKQTYPHRTGVHSNTAFGLCFAYDWAKYKNDEEFLKWIVKKSHDFYLQNTQIPAHLEPDGSDFFSPSLQAADLMTRILSTEKYVTWFNQYFTSNGIERVCLAPTVSDRSDYQIVHLEGLSFSRAWNMKNIARKLPARHPIKKIFEAKADERIAQSLKVIFDGGYGGEHWLATFAVVALFVK